MVPDHYISITYWNFFLRYAEDQHLDISALWERITATDNAEFVPFEHLKKLVEVMFEQGADPWVGLDMCKDLSVAIHGFMGFGLSHAKDLEQCLAFIEQYQRTRTGMLDYQLTIGEVDVDVSILPRSDWSPYEIVIYECLITILLNTLYYAVGKRSDECRIELPYDAPTWIAKYEQILTPHVIFGADRARILFPASWLTIPCVSGDEKNHQLAKAQCDMELSRLNQLVLVSDRVKVVLTESEQYNQSIESVARQLNMSKSTLIRKLKAEESSFKKIQESLRKQEAVRMLVESNHKIDSIALALGYEDVSNFSRSFKRWFDCSPGTYREAHLGTK